ncbi:MAG: D-aminoacyl-tRNA deacylase, partial [Thermoplasmata archaeon]|nr:D-aminoacyl-tRNA deacylase [Thermoplasmata archaeon]
ALDPVARAVSECWGTLPATGWACEGAPLRALSDRAWVLKRPGHHVLDANLELALPPGIGDIELPLVFPSVHRSESERPCLTVHPLGNPGPSAEVGGAPSQLGGTAPRLMADALRRIAELGKREGLGASFEATHHGPLLRRPAFFVEIGFGAAAAPPPSAVRGLAALLGELTRDDRDRVAVGLGGGHYAPHFTELALERHWAFGHILSKHALSTASPQVIRQALERTPGAEGFLYQRAQDEVQYDLGQIAKRLRDGEAPALGGP